MFHAQGDELLGNGVQGLLCLRNPTPGMGRKIITPHKNFKDDYFSYFSSNPGLCVFLQQTPPNCFIDYAPLLFLLSHNSLVVEVVYYNTILQNNYFSKEKYWHGLCSIDKQSTPWTDLASSHVCGHKINTNFMCYVLL